MNSQPVTESELATRTPAPRITPSDIEASIRSEHYFTAYEGVMGEQFHHESSEAGSDMSEASVAVPDELRLLTMCVLVLNNGFTILGQSACASAENYNKDIGQRVARENAINQMWPLLGYELRTKLFNRSQPSTSDEEFLVDGERSIAQALEDAAKGAGGDNFSVENL